MSEPTVALLVRVRASVKARLAEMAKQERRSLSKQVELLLEQCLDPQSPQSVAVPLKSGRRREA